MCNVSLHSTNLRCVDPAPEHTLRGSQSRDLVADPKTHSDTIYSMVAVHMFTLNTPIPAAKAWLGARAISVKTTTTITG